MVVTNLKERELINFVHTLEKRNISEEALDYILIFLEDLEYRGLKSSQMKDSDREVLDYMDDTTSELEYSLGKERKKVYDLTQELLSYQEQSKDNSPYQELETLKRENQILKETVTKQLVLKKALKDFLT